MNNRIRVAEVDRLRLPDTNRDLFRWIATAATIRLWLYYDLFLSESVEQNSIYEFLIRILRSSSIAEISSLVRDQIFIYVHILKKQYGYTIGSETIDYAIPSILTEQDRQKYANIPLVGERRLLYHAFCKVYGNSKSANTSLQRLLYIYILAKNKVRQILVQNNRVKGFSNFSKFETRKLFFIPSESLYEKVLVFCAIRTNLQNQAIRKLEVRVTPYRDRWRFYRYLLSIDAIVNRNLFVNGDIDQLTGARLGFIVHFIKTKETIGRFSELRYRNYSLRMRINQEAAMITRLFQCQIPIQTNIPWIVGIDAANSEFNARPEVFGSVYRQMNNVLNSCVKDGYFIDANKRFLGRTFHVGEDFYDVVDGLRAINEAVIFLNLKRGDRMGHAVALGLDVAKYYNCRNKCVVMPKQVLLDNIAWLMIQMDNYSLPDCEGLKGKLQTNYAKYLIDIYGSVIGAQYIPSRCYYNSWLMRGDWPYRQDEDIQRNTSPMGRLYEKNQLEIVRSARNDSMARELFRAYHYEPEVKRQGEVLVEYIVSEASFDIIEQLQRILQKEIAQKDIAIETNPTSNLKITDVERYAEHPIVKFNNYYLEPNDTDNAQISVSINTDDQGVFSTSLEKEYTLMALALEKEGRYRREDIYQWLDHVREMAHWYSFLK